MTLKNLYRFSIIALLAIALVVSVGTPVQAVPMTSEYVFNDYLFFGDGHTYDYVSIVDFHYGYSDFTMGGIYVGTAPELSDTFSWTHSLPSGLSVPPDVIDRAKLWIDGAYIDNNNNEISIQGTLDWDPLSYEWCTFDNSTYWLTDVTEPGFWNDGGIEATVTANEYVFRLDASILMMDYTTGGAVPGPEQNPVPEPGTLVLLGMGLAGAGMSRLRMRRNS